MKTLDEVIKAIEEKLGVGGEEAIENSLETDALHYLMELRDMTDIPMEYFESGGTLDDPDGEHQQLLKCQALLQDFYRNDPLTWDELKQMVGKPVWIQAGGGFWGIIVDVEENRFWYRCRFADHDYCDREYMGEYWNAYRKEFHDV